MGRFQVGLMSAVVLGTIGFMGLNLGCSPKVMPATSHMATTPDQVKIYQKQPAEYEQLGTIEVEVTPGMKLDENGDADKVYMALLQKAAAKGANGLLLWAAPGTYDLVVTAGYGKEWHQVPVKVKPTKTAIAQAIYVRME